MLRFVQSIHKVFRSSQSRAPCGQLTKDNEETYQSETLGQRQFYSSALSVNSLDFDGNGEHGAGSHSTWGSRRLPGLVEGAFVGAGYTFLNTIHGICSGKNKNRQQYCPISAANRLADNVKRALVARSDHLRVLPKKKHEIQRQPNGIKNREPETLTLQSDIDLEKRKRVSDGVLSLKSVDKENLAVDHLLGLQAWKDQDYSLAASLWQRTLREISSPVAAHRLGVCYEHGLGVEVDTKKAAKYYQKAVDYEYTPAMYKLAMLHLDGRILDKSVKPMKLLKKASDMGLTEAQTYMGSYNFHKGNKDLAVKYFELASAKDDAEACYYMGVCFETGAGLSCADDSKAAHYYERGADLGHPDAQYNLAVFLEEGYGGLERDYALSLVWYRRAEAQGNLTARSRLIELGCLHAFMNPSNSMPSFKTLITCMSKHLQLDASGTCSHMPRSRSDSFLGSNGKKSDTSSYITEKYLESSHLDITADSFSTEGRPKFFVPNENSMVDNEDSVEWSSGSSLDSPSTEVACSYDDMENVSDLNFMTATAHQNHPSALSNHLLRTCSTTSLTRSDTAGSFNVVFV